MHQLGQSQPPNSMHVNMTLHQKKLIIIWYETPNINIIISVSKRFYFDSQRPYQGAFFVRGISRNQHANRIIVAAADKYEL